MNLGSKEADRPEEEGGLEKEGRQEGRGQERCHLLEEANVPVPVWTCRRTRSRKRFVFPERSGSTTHSKRRRLSTWLPPSICSPTQATSGSSAGASIAYGLTKGGYNAPQIEIEPLGLRIVRPTSEGDDVEAKRQALLIPRVVGEFLRKYNNAPLPREDIGRKRVDRHECSARPRSRRSRDDPRRC